MYILNCSEEDIPAILDLYEGAIQLQTALEKVVWPHFEAVFVLKEISESRQWKLVVDGEIACNWAITLEDKEIWEEKDMGDSIYIHRICTNPKFRGNRYIDILTEWAKAYARHLGKKYVRLDTLDYNTKLIEHYISAGFTFLGMHELTNTATLPRHYQEEPNCCFFEIEL